MELCLSAYSSALVWTGPRKSVGDEECKKLLVQFDLWGTAG